VRLNWKLAVNLLTVLALAVVMVGWLVTQLIGNSGFVNKPFTVTADFAASGGVFTNQEVTYRGVLIGRVGEMSLPENSDGVAIELMIDPEWEKEIPANVTAEVQSKSAVGEQFVNLTPPPSVSEDTLADGSRIPRSRTKLPVDFQALLQSLDNVLADLPSHQTNRVVRNLASSLRGREGDIKTILSSLSTLSDAFVEVAPQQTRLLKNATDAGEAFLASKDDLTAAIKAADDVFAGLGDEPAEMKRFFKANDKVAREGIALLKRQSKNYLEGIRGLADLTEFQLREQEVIAASFDHVPGFLHAIEDASVPWKAADGSSTYYRIRGGLILDNVPKSWPCGYKNPFEYERLPHEREPQPVDKAAECEALAPTAAARELASALRIWASDDPKLIALREEWEAAGSPSLSSDRFRWPLDGAVTSPYGPRWGRMHTGLDIDGDYGDPIGASASGTVTLATYYSGYGNAVIVDHGEGFSTLYGHMSGIGVEVGDRVAQGQFLGLVGCTGHCFGDHLHFEIRVDNRPVDPLPYLEGKFTIFGEGIVAITNPISDAVDDEPGKEAPKKGKKKRKGPNQNAPGVKAPPKGKPGPSRPKPKPTPEPMPTQDPEPSPEPTPEPTPAETGGEGATGEETSDPSFGE
jgi:virulence factor Mce-like protein